jgi:hypothetical protein
MGTFFPQTNECIQVAVSGRCLKLGRAALKLKSPTTTLNSSWVLCCAQKRQFCFMQPADAFTLESAQRADPRSRAVLCAGCTQLFDISIDILTSVWPSASWRHHWHFSCAGKAQQVWFNLKQSRTAPPYFIFFLTIAESQSAAPRITAIETWLFKNGQSTQ